ncbi:MAG: TIGR04282 family arsenosugar biosynthesis glycosyltransferase [Anaerolineales bacterium]
MTKSNTLLVVAKQPAPGQTKTRLCPPLTYEQAATLYDCFLRDTLQIMRQVPNVQRGLVYLPNDAREYFHKLAPDMELTCQRGMTLGERLDNLLTDSLHNGSQRVVVINSDSPTLPAAYLSQAFDDLAKADVVLGPTQDGGYYLIGIKQPQPDLLHKVQMSTPHVLADTLALAESSGLTVSLLPTWYDVDTIEDLVKLDNEIADINAKGKAPATQRWLSKTNWRNQQADLSRISLIIPALNEADCLARLLDEVPVDLIHQVIVVDNGSTDNTGEVAQKAGAFVVVEPRRGYGFACAAGVAAAEGDVLVFMDGDGSFVPAELSDLLKPIAQDKAELVLGSRTLNGSHQEVMPLHQRVGNRLFAWLLRKRYGLNLTDLGPFRAVKREVVLQLNMQEFTYGWPLEMMIKSARHQMRILEVPVTYRPRFAGQSKVSGSLRGSILAAYRFFRVMLRYGL